MTTEVRLLGNPPPSTTRLDLFNGISKGNSCTVLRYHTRHYSGCTLTINGATRYTVGRGAETSGKAARYLPRRPVRLKTKLNKVVRLGKASVQPLASTAAAYTVTTSTGTPRRPQYLVPPTQQYHQHDRFSANQKSGSRSYRGMWATLCRSRRVCYHSCEAAHARNRTEIKPRTHKGNTYNRQGTTRKQHRWKRPPIHLNGAGQRWEGGHSKASNATTVPMFLYIFHPALLWIQPQWHRRTYLPLTTATDAQAPAMEPDLLLRAHGTTNTNAKSTASPPRPPRRSCTHLFYLLVLGHKLILRLRTITKHTNHRREGPARSVTQQKHTNTRPSEHGTADWPMVSFHRRHALLERGLLLR